MSQFRNWQVDVVVSLTGCEKTASFKLRVEKEEKKNNFLHLCYPGRESFFFRLGFVSLPFLVHSWMFFGNVTPDSPLHHEWPGRNVCGGVRFEEDREREQVKKCTGAWQGQSYQSDENVIPETLQAAAFTKLPPTTPTKSPQSYAAPLHNPF